MKKLDCGRAPAMARACAIGLLFGLMLGGCDDEGGRMEDGGASDGDGPAQVEHRGECGTASLRLSGAHEGEVTLGSTGIVGAGTCLHGVVGDELDGVSLHCLFHDPGSENLVLGKQFSMHINDFEWGPRSWTIEDLATQDGDYDGIVRYFDYVEENDAIAWVSGLEGARCTVTLSRSSEDGVEGGVSCDGLSSGPGEVPLSLEGTFCVEPELILEAED